MLEKDREETERGQRLEVAGQQTEQTNSCETSVSAGIDVLHFVYLV